MMGGYPFLQHGDIDVRLTPNAKEKLEDHLHPENLLVTETKKDTTHKSHSTILTDDNDDNRYSTLQQSWIPNWNMQRMQLSALKCERAVAIRPGKETSCHKGLLWWSLEIATGESLETFGVGCWQDVLFPQDNAPAHKSMVAILERRFELGPHVLFVRFGSPRLPRFSRWKN